MGGVSGWGLWRGPGERCRERGRSVDLGLSLEKRAEEEMLFSQPWSVILAVVCLMAVDLVFVGELLGVQLV